MSKVGGRAVIELKVRGSAIRLATNCTVFELKARGSAIRLATNCTDTVQFVAILSVDPRALSSITARSHTF